MHESPGYVGGMFEVDNGLNNIQAPEWITIDVVMDSGAVEAVSLLMSLLGRQWRSRKAHAEARRT